MKRDALEAADDALWGDLIAERDGQTAVRRYQAAVRYVESLGFSYKTTTDIAANDSRAAFFERMDALTRAKTDWERNAILGRVEPPTVTVTEAFRVYVEEIVPHQLTGKSETQKKDWQKVKRRAISNFVELCGDKPLKDITRDDALTFYRFWMQRIAPHGGEGRPTHSASSGNRDVGNMRALFREYFNFAGDRDRRNPFEGLNFRVLKRSRPPFPVEWVVAKMLQARGLAPLNPEARGICLVMVEKGARPSEICNLRPEAIRLDVPVPHIRIEPSTDPDDPREIKTASSVREIPLVGVALAVLQRYPEGFPRYRNRERTLSNTLNKSFRLAGLLPTPEHSVYSLRHTFEDRMKVGGVDEELRRILMGHSIDRPRYGAGGTLEWRQKALLAIALPFDPSIV